mmetsp:Transcript_22336/g.47629  ORF Transcript_22336/g.47629 Transcript_22336/m.47629 type:complete len:153 (+) Transcript_22336:77-535(+)
MAAVGTFVFEGKEFPLWTEAQLERLNREALKQKGMNLRDHVGADRLAPMPRHPEGLVQWILETQAMLTRSGPPSSYAGMASRDVPPTSNSSAYGAGVARAQNGATDSPRAGSVAGSHFDEEAHQAYAESRNGAEAARNRNRGSQMRGVFSHE